MPIDPKGPPAKAPKTPQAGGKAAGGIKGGLTRKVGPLPVWGWAAIAGGAFVAWTFLRGGSGEDQGQYGVAGLGSLAGGGGGGGGGYGGSGSAGGSGGAGGVADAVDDVAAQLPPALAPGGDSSGIVNTPSFVPGTADIENITNYQDYRAAQQELIASLPGDTPMSYIQDLLGVQSGQPESVLTTSQYQTFVMGQYPGQTPDLLTNPNAAYDRVAWYEYLKALDPREYVGVNIGTRTDEYGRQLNLDEYYRNLEIARINAQTAASGLPEGSLGYPSASGAPPTITSLPVGSITPIAAPSTAPAPVDYSGAIKTLEGYIANLNTGTVTQADRDKIALYQARIAEYSAR